MDAVRVLTVMVNCFITKISKKFSGSGENLLDSFGALGYEFLRGSQFCAGTPGGGSSQVAIEQRLSLCTTPLF